MNETNGIVKDRDKERKTGGETWAFSVKEVITNSLNKVFRLQFSDTEEIFDEKISVSEQQNSFIVF